jgi:transketolase
MSDKATRAAFGETLAELGGQFKDVVALDADLSKSTMSKHFAERFPERFFEMGIQEANMIGAAAGLASMGKIPFLCSFACFLTGRFDTIRISACYSGANVRFVGTHSGIAIGEDGYSQMGLEDLALMRSVPEMAVIQPSDTLETEKAVRYLIESHQGPAYLRLTRQKLPELNSKLDSYRFEFGKGVLHREGKDLTLIATGATLKSCLEASEQLEKELNLSAEILNIHTIRPLDKDMILQSAKKTGKVVTVEDHQITGGLGDEVASTLSENLPTPMKKIGVRDTFGESGSPEDLYRKHQLDGEGVFKQVKEWLS